MSNNKTFTKETLDNYLKELSKEFRKEYGKNARAEIVLVGGAAILSNYNFREMTTDIDATIHSNASMKSVINRVGDNLGLPNGWLNSDFVQTNSFSPKINQYSKYYKTFGNIEYRTMSGEYLIAMKLCSGRSYKNDISDIVGILKEHKEIGNPINLNQIDKAVKNLYGNWDKLPENSDKLISEIISNDNFIEDYNHIQQQESRNKEIIKQAEIEASNNKDISISNIINALTIELSKELTDVSSELEDPIEMTDKTLQKIETEERDSKNNFVENEFSKENDDLTPLEINLAPDVESLRKECDEIMASDEKMVYDEVNQKAKESSIGDN